MSGAQLVLHQFRYTNRAFWRNPAAAFFTFAFPLLFLVIFTVLFGRSTTCVRFADGRCLERVSTSTFYVASIAAFSVITACFTNVAMSVTFARETGVLKRVRGTPMPGWTYLAGRVLHAVAVAALLVAITVAFGAAFYGATVSWRTLPAFALTLLVGAASFCALGLALTAAVPNADAAPAVVNAVILPLLFISDVFVPLREDAPRWLAALAAAFPVKHFLEAMLASFFPLPGHPTLRPGDLLVLAAWGIGGAVLAVRFFSWEPRR
ncbi:MAG TPA: ABC transporter permease [Actinomycetota bacterium]|nr:ABC transporter permease [Actinomycetota bacterium]